MLKKKTRLKRARKFRARSRISDLPRLCVFRTPRHIYAQVLKRVDGKSEVLACASTVEKDLKAKVKDIKGKAEVAKFIGQEVANRAKAKGVEKVAFDRAGFQFHGRVKSLAEGAREAGLVF